ncbi:hypothetical protein SLEP1_g35651 [Rubroshorea leprosula]|uniref:Maternal effect embryo arrest 59 n=1 Tax=Rubroshorea leprosula TaxID=152421 RepID=A0AAV5KNV6_9ROSI|nr:hypothetical protein SLEP1_g35651 [Rubroshorea leprosula]
MVGQLTVTKPSRSDDVLDPDQQQKITAQVRAQLDSLAPKRPAKPNRSEPDSTSPSATALPPGVDQTIPELNKLRSLQSQFPVKISVDGELEVPDEFVETEYYRELHSIDKQHHTTGNGFIRVSKDDGEESGNDIEPEVSPVPENIVVRRPLGSNPATNDWIPSVEENQVFVSSKPNRSEGC